MCATMLTPTVARSWKDSFLAAGDQGEKKMKTKRDVSDTNEPRKRCSHFPSRVSYVREPRILRWDSTRTSVD